jgi:hypothetical protein
MQTLTREGTHVGASTVQMFRQDVSNPKASQRLISVVEKDPRIRAEIQVMLLAMIAEDMGGLRPQRTEAFFSAFAEEPDLKRSYQLQIASPQIDDLLHACACVEHGCQKSVVSATIPTGSADSRKNGFDFSALEVFNNALTGAFEGDAQNALNSVELFGMVGSHVTKKKRG